MKTDISTRGWTWYTYRQSFSNMRGAGYGVRGVVCRVQGIVCRVRGVRYDLQDAGIKSRVRERLRIKKAFS